MKYSQALIAAITCNVCYGSIVVSGLDTVPVAIAGSTSFTSGGSWAGDGTVQPFYGSQDPANASGSGTIISGLSGGTLVMNDIALAGNSSTFTPAGLTMTHTFSITGGTSDLVGKFSSGTANPPGNLNNYELTPSAGATSISWTTTYSHALHARRGSANTLPWLGSLDLPGSSTVDVSYGGVYTAVSPTGTATIVGATTVPGVAGGISNATVQGKFTGAVSEPSPGTLTYTRTGSTFVSHINAILPQDTAGDYASGASVYSLPNLSDGELIDGERVYGDTITWTITPDGMAAFDGTQSFVFSFDGGLGAIPVVVPEPASAALLGLGVIGFLARRKRA